MNRLIINNHTDLSLDEVMPYINTIMKCPKKLEDKLRQYVFEDGTIVVIKKNKKSYSIYLYKEEVNNEF